MRNVLLLLLLGAGIAHAQQLEAFLERTKALTTSELPSVDSPKLTTEDIIYMEGHKVLVQLPGDSKREPEFYSPRQEEVSNQTIYSIQIYATDQFSETIKEGIDLEALELVLESQMKPYLNKKNDKETLPEIHIINIYRNWGELSYKENGLYHLRRLVGERGLRISFDLIDPRKGLVHRYDCELDIIHPNNEMVIDKCGKSNLKKKIDKFSKLNKRKLIISFDSIGYVSPLVTTAEEVYLALETKLWTPFGEPIAAFVPVDQKVIDQSVEVSLELGSIAGGYISPFMDMAYDIIIDVSNRWNPIPPFYTAEDYQKKEKYNDEEEDD